MACMFCTRCGKCGVVGSLVAEPGRCLMCGGEVPKDARVCPGCGAPIVDAAGDARKNASW